VARWRLVLALAVLAALVTFCGLLFGPYYRNWKLQGFLEGIAFDAGRAANPEGVFQAEVANEAARLGIPVGSDQIRVSKREQGVYLEARYIVRVDLYLYTVDLHFRPSAGVR
jgi:hypothetical protein